MTADQAIRHHSDSLHLSVAKCCPLCGSEKLRAKFDVRHISDDPAHPCAPELGLSVATIFACRNCTFVFKSPTPTDAYLHRHYVESGEAYLTSLAEELDEVRRDFHIARHLLCDAFPRGGSILDVGCASGFFLETLGQNWNRHGLEVFHLAAERARQRPRIVVHECEFASAGFDKESFDVVSLFDVVEHLSDPLPLFREARRIVKSGGWLILGTGNAGSFAARTSGSRWTYMCLPEHLSFFTRRALRNGLAKVGFSQINFKRLHHGEMHYSVASGWLRAVGKHWALSLFGEDILRLRIFRHKTTEFLVPYFFDHMICIAR